jgi:hypothetical protein
MLPARLVAFEAGLFIGSPPPRRESDFTTAFDQCFVCHCGQRPATAAHWLAADELVGVLGPREQRRPHGDPLGRPGRMQCIYARCEEGEAVATTALTLALWPCWSIRR